MKDLKFVDIPTFALTESEWEQAATLFSNHYGIWGKGGVSPGSRVRLSTKRLQRLCEFDRENCRVAFAFKLHSDNSEPSLIGQAFYIKKYDKEFDGNILWITQLVVDSSHRRRRIATTLCNMACGERDIFAAGLVSSHPCAVKSLENALNNTINVTTVKLYAPRLITKLQIPYLSTLQIDIIDPTENGSKVKCVCHTEFHIDHTKVNLIRDSLPSWNLGSLSEGDEYLAVVLTGMHTRKRP